MKLLIPGPPGELIDKITILKVKLLYIHDKKKTLHIKHYLAELERVRKTVLNKVGSLASLERQLFAVNKNQWNIEDAIRTHLKEKTPDKSFGRLVQNLHKSNDRRVAIKRRIDTHVGSELFDEKQYVR